MNFEELLEFSIKELEIIESDIAKIDDVSQVEEKTKDAIGYLRKLADKVMEEGGAVEGTKGSKFLCAFAQDVAFPLTLGLPPRKSSTTSLEYAAKIKRCMSHGVRLS